MRSFKLLKNTFVNVRKLYYIILTAVAPAECPWFVVASTYQKWPQEAKTVHPVLKIKMEPAMKSERKQIVTVEAKNCW